MSAAEISSWLSEAVPSAPPTRERLAEWCEGLWRACRALEARQDELVAVVKDLEARIKELESAP
jgi:hypothetical protein